MPALIALEIYIFPIADLYLQPFGQCVYDGRADTVQAARYFISAAAEFAARMQDGKDDRNGGNPHFLVDADGYTASVVVHADDIARQDTDVDFCTVARERLVDCVIHNLIYQMVQAARPC